MERVRANGGEEEGKEGKRRGKGEEKERERRRKRKWDGWDWVGVLGM